MGERTTEIRIETRERILFRQTSSREVQATCSECEGTSLFIEPERFALLCKTSMREVFRRVESGSVHSLETATGATLVCVGSLSNTFADRPALPVGVENIEGAV